MYFGENAGKQCVTMSLSALIYNKIKGIHSCNDVVQIMKMGNQLYSTLSQCTGQVYLMQTELLCFRKITSLIIVKATVVICITVIQ